MANENNSSIGLGGLLGVLFVGLKLTHYIDWPWLWVLSPFWIPIILFLAILVASSVMAAILFCIGALFKGKW